MELKPQEWITLTILDPEKRFVYRCAKRYFRQYLSHSFLEHSREQTEQSQDVLFPCIQPTKHGGDFAKTRAHQSQTQGLSSSGATEFGCDCQSSNAAKQIITNLEQSRMD